ncbi:MAG: hypothetical protein ACF8SC_08660 [Phycisphaerales bacterium JB037]
MRQRSKSGTGGLRASKLGAVALVGGGLALLLWAKLRLVTEVPRTAYAEPEVRADADGAEASDPAPVDGAGRSGDASDEPVGERTGGRAGSGDPFP